MKFKFKFFAGCLLSCVVLFPLLSHAEPGVNPLGSPVSMNSNKHDIVGNRLASLTNRLGLTDAQQAEVKTILQDEVNAMKQLRDNTVLSKEDKKLKYQELRKGTNDKIRSILNADQQKIHDDTLKKISDRRNKMEKRNLVPTPSK